MDTSVTLENAIEQIRAYVCENTAENLPLVRAAGRVIAEDLHSQMNNPPFPRSPLDGYAVRGADVAYASKESPVTLRVIGLLFAGDDGSSLRVRKGEAVRIMTGAMIPGGADCVIRQEDSDEGDGFVKLYAGIKAYDNYCCTGEDFAEGELLLKTGTYIDSAAVAVAASAGIAQIKVHKKVRAAVISTGDELQQPGEKLNRGKIYDSNASGLAVRLLQLGTEVVSVEAVKDSIDAITAAIKAASKSADVVVTTGGVSVGQKDLVAKALEVLNAQIVFHGIRIKPGMPTLFAMIGNAAIFGLSGNPFSAAVAFELLMPHMLAGAQGAAAYSPVVLRTVAQDGFEKPSHVRRFLRGIYSEGRVKIPQAQSNAQMRSMIGCNCLLDIPAGSGVLKAGDAVRAILLRNCP
jgi:molybdopterin molybdotransferase